MSALISDAGNRKIMAKIAKREYGEVAFSQVTKSLIEVEYTSILPRSIKDSHRRNYILTGG